MQLELRIKLPTPDPAAWLRARGFYCAAKRLTLTPAACVRAQTAEPSRKGPRGDDYCRSGGCLQGLAVLVEAGLAKRETCACCGGRGWTPVKCRPQGG